MFRESFWEEQPPRQRSGKRYQIKTRSGGKLYMMPEREGLKVCNVIGGSNEQKRQSGRAFDMDFAGKIQ